MVVIVHYLSNVPNYKVMNELVENFRQLTVDEKETIEYVLEEFCSYISDKWYIIDITRANIDINF